MIFELKQRELEGLMREKDLEIEQVSNGWIVHCDGSSRDKETVVFEDKYLMTRYVTNYFDEHDLKNDEIPE